MSKDRMTLGSWPGYSQSHNAFQKVFLDSLAEAGADIVSLESVDALASASVDAIVLHWAETLFWQSRGRVQLLQNTLKTSRFFARSKAKRPKLVWVAHNLAPHRPAKKEALVWPWHIRAMTRAVDGVMTLSPGTVDTVRTAFPVLKDTPFHAIWHPPYPRPTLSVQAARQSLGLPLDAQVFGYCGQLRRYKKLDALVAAFQQTSEPHFRLLIAGKPMEPDMVAILEAAAAQDPRILLKAEDLSAEAFDAALMAIDVGVFPSGGYLHSGSLVHALSAGCTALACTTPFAESYATLLGPEVITTYSGTLTADHLVAAARSGSAAREDRLAGLSERLAPLDPARTAPDTLAFIRSL